MANSTIQVQRRLITVDEYEQMVQAGVFQEDDRIELIEGEILELPPIGSGHAAVINRINQLLVQRAGGAAQVSVQNPVRLGISEPQPDIALLRPRADYYAEALPRSEDVLLLIEVADSSEAFHRGVKVPLYARNGIREVWLVVLSERVVEVYREPSASGYRAKQTFGTGNKLAPQLLTAIVMEAEEIFGV